MSRPHIRPGPAPRRARRFALALLLGFLGSACHTTPRLMPTPNVWLDPARKSFDTVAAGFRTNVVDVLFVTDRQPITDSAGRLTYGSGRSRSLAFGVCQVNLGRDVSWDELVTLSTTRKRTTRLPLTLRAVHELGRFPETPYPLVRRDATWQIDPQVERAHLNAEDQLLATLRGRLEHTPRKEAFVFIHGSINGFARANVLAAQLWHFLPREGVPIAYTWPAGRGGLRGYSYDRESGEFTVYHLKQFLRVLLACPELQRIHLLAHSRGADVLTTSLRELALEQRGAGLAVPRLPKVANIILIAPDLDVQVASQRLAAEHLYYAADRLTIYVCPEDRAITFANWMFEGIRRLGILRTSDLTPEARALVRQATHVQFVDARVKAGFLGHGYFHNHPAASSDLLQLLHHNCDAGTPDRPLQRDDDLFWRITENYLTP